MLHDTGHLPEVLCQAWLRLHDIFGINNLHRSRWHGPITSSWVEQRGWRSHQGRLPTGISRICPRWWLQPIRSLGLLRQSRATRRGIHYGRPSILHYLLEQLHAPSTARPRGKPELLPRDQVRHEPILVPPCHLPALRLPTFLLHVPTLPLDWGDKHASTDNRRAESSGWRQQWRRIWCWHRADVRSRKRSRGEAKTDWGMNEINEWLS